MMWFFAILIVLAMGGVAAVAVGRGAPMTDAYVDNADVLVPADGPLTSADLRRARFPMVLRGYRMSDVDALLDRLADQLADAALAPEPVPAQDEDFAPKVDARADDPTADPADWVADPAKSSGE